MARSTSRRPRKPARAQGARSRASRRGSGQGNVPDILTIGRFLARPEILGAALVVAAVAVIPYLLPLAGLLRDARNGAVGALGVHVFTATMLLAILGMLVATRQGAWLKRRRRHLMGLLLLLMFTAGALGFWYPERTVGAIDLREHSAGGDLGRVITDHPAGVAAWLLSLPVGFALLWPVTARRIIAQTPSVALMTWHGTGVAFRGLRRGVAAFTARKHEREAALDATLPLQETYDALASRRTEAVLDIDAPLEALNQPVEADGAPEPDPRPSLQTEMDFEHPSAAWRHAGDGWQLPPLEILQPGKPQDRSSSKVDNQARAQLITETLASFGVDARVTEINEGPTITQFGVEPGWDVKTKTMVERDAEGQAITSRNGQPATRDVEISRTRIRVNRITALQNDLALALAAPSLRIEAPVPGKPIVGIEVPNASVATVTLRDVMETPAFKRMLEKGALPVALGTGVSGEAVIADLAKMPHLLIAGATGSGKSVMLNAVISCLLMNYSPEELRFVMIDPKRVELTAFGRVPHLAFSHIIVEMDEVVGTLQAVIHEMESRYRRFAREGVRNIEAFNNKASEALAMRRLPYWVVVIDELADLMLAAPFQVENQLVRLAQLARATGIHLVVATQRPSVDVVTGLIKANFPTRIAFAMASQVDSRTVLDQVGAEKLLGRGDMLYVPTDSQKPKRVQGVYVSDAEIEATVEFWASERFTSLAPEKHDELLAEAQREVEQMLEESAAEEDDPMIAKAIEVAKQEQKLSTSLLQRKLRIGYPRAARLMDDLEQRGVVGPPEGAGSSRPVITAALTGFGNAGGSRGAPVDNGFGLD